MTSTANTVPQLPLNSGHQIPQLGFGVFKVGPEETERIVGHALALGYRHIDTASMYGNEEGVGKAIAGSGIPREEIFVTTKLRNADQGAASAYAALDASLERLGLDYVDLYLIHWPEPARGLYVETWLALEEMAAAGKARSIGVSNFLPEHLQAVLDAGSVVPAVNQIELHPAYQQRDVTAFGQQHGILTQSWGPLGQGKYPLLEDPQLAAIAAAHGKSPAQVVLRWHIQQGTIVFPKSSRPDRIRENFELFDFELTAAEQDTITAMERGGRVGKHPLS